MTTKLSKQFEVPLEQLSYYISILLLIFSPKHRSKMALNSQSVTHSKVSQQYVVVLTSSSVLAPFLNDDDRERIVFFIDARKEHTSRLQTIQSRTLNLTLVQRDQYTTRYITERRSRVPGKQSFGSLPNAHFLEIEPILLVFFFCTSPRDVVNYRHNFVRYMETYLRGTFARFKIYHELLNARRTSFDLSNFSSILA